MIFTLTYSGPQGYMPCGFFHFVTPELNPNNGIYLGRHHGTVPA
jgi:hypothetical protein